MVRVRRTGGFAGLVAAGELDLDARGPARARGSAPWSSASTCRAAAGDPEPDRFVYDFDLCGERARVPEQHLTADLRRLVTLLL